MENFELLLEGDRRVQGDLNIVLHERYPHVKAVTHFQKTWDSATTTSIAISGVSLLVGIIGLVIQIQQTATKERGGSTPTTIKIKDLKRDKELKLVIDGDNKIDAQKIIDNFLR